MIVLKLPKEERDRLIGRVQAYFNEERGEEIGNLAAELCLDYMLRELGPALYNQAIQDAVKVAGEKMVSLEDDLLSLKKSTR